ncbi:hypothetical protein HHK36_007627 [Tetracentron sinense]|uniref:BHLH domain-containing protein n=1 Tax=Tetracentron sinense TaxID=13715 RepID=A0A834ZTV7_TETSI|nr:hypothetical protein HHK36_007627 [Tetracentron sinense]
MAAFSYQYPRFDLESVFQPHTPIKISALLEDGNVGTACFSPFDPSEPLLDQIPFDVRIHQSSCLDNTTRVPLRDNELSLTEKLNTDSSSMAVQLESGDQITQKDTPMEKRMIRDDQSVLDSAHSKDTRKAKVKKQKNSNGSLKYADEKKLKADKKSPMKVPEEATTGYVHVRARRGQATDSHSLAERVRREKISERMKHLQGLVPGCEKIIGKALILDEIINYVQSMQNQVEFLSMKLASVNPMLYGFGVELDAFMVNPEKLSNSASSLPLVQQSSPTQPAAFANTTTIFTTTNNYPLLESSASINVLNQGQSSNGLYQDNGNLLWDVDDQRQRFINQSGFNNSSTTERETHMKAKLPSSLSVPMEWASSPESSDSKLNRFKGYYPQADKLLLSLGPADTRRQRGSATKRSIQSNPLFCLVFGFWAWVGLSTTVGVGSWDPDPAWFTLRERNKPTWQIHGLLNSLLPLSREIGGKMEKKEGDIDLIGWCPHPL